MVVVHSVKCDFCGAYVIESPDANLYDRKAPEADGTAANICNRCLGRVFVKSGIKIGGKEWEG